MDQARLAQVSDGLFGVTGASEREERAVDGIHDGDMKVVLIGYYYHSCQRF